MYYINVCDIIITMAVLSLVLLYGAPNEIFFFAADVIPAHVLTLV